MMPISIIKRRYSIAITTGRICSNTKERAPVAVLCLVNTIQDK